MGRSELIVVIPAYREAGTIGQLVADIRQHAPIIVVDDASGDKTAEVAAAAGAQVVVNTCNMGYEGALNVGFEVAAARRPRAILTVDADGEHGAEHVVSFSRLLLDESVPLVLGRRRRPQRVAEAAVGALIRIRYGVSDVFCGMKGYHTELWRRHGCFDSRMGVGTELALAAIRGGVPFRELTVNGTPRTNAPRFGNRFLANWRVLRAVTGSLAVPAVEISK
jgi:glycosyltransferase involved in cell wall biosynthesis